MRSWNNKRLAKQKFNNAVYCYGYFIVKEYLPVEYFVSQGLNRNMEFNLLIVIDLDAFKTQC